LNINLPQWPQGSAKYRDFGWILLPRQNRTGSVALLTEYVEQRLTLSSYTAIARVVL
jgi:hypothetical protein